MGAPLVLPWLIIGIAALMAYARANVDLSLRTVIATQTVCTFPLVTAIVAAQLFRFQKVQEEAAIDLGCSRLQVLRHIILPHIVPALAAAGIFAFTWSFNNYEISAFTLGLPADVPDLGVLVGPQPRSHGDRERDLHADLGRRRSCMIWFALRLLRSRSGDEGANEPDRRHRGGRGGGEDLMATVGDVLGIPTARRRKRPSGLGARGRGAFGHPVRAGHPPDPALPAAVADHGADERGEVPAHGSTAGTRSSHYVEVLTNDLNLHIALRPMFIATTAMAIMLVIAMPLAYFMVFKAGKWELFLLLSLVLADELAPVVKVYAWQVILGRNGILNWLIPGPPVEWLLYSRFAVILTLATTYITYTTIPIYAAMKAIEPADVRSRHRPGRGLVAAGAQDPDPARRARASSSR